MRAGRMGGMLVILLMFPQLLLAQLSSEAFVVSCTNAKNCIKQSKEITNTMSTGLVSEVCQSSEDTADLACYTIVDRALELGSELPVSYLKDECFGGSARTSRKICRELDGLCEKYPKSDSCKKIIPEQANSGAAYLFKSTCTISERDCEITAKSNAKAISAEEITEVCKISGDVGILACRSILKLTVGKKFTLEFWNAQCDDSKKTAENKNFCETTISVCADKSEVFCDELKKATAKEEEGGSMMLIIIVAGAAVVILGIAVAIFLLRKKIFKSHYAKKTPKKGADKDKKKKKKKKTGSKGSVADSEVTTEAESAQVSAQGSAAGQPPTEKKEESWLGVPYSHLLSDWKEPSQI